MTTEQDTPDDSPTAPLSSREPGFEARVFGIWGNIIRYISGVVSVFTMCYIAYMDAVTVRISIERGTGWPSEWHFFIMTVGVTICAMSFSNANKTISTILSTTTLKDRAKDLLLSKISGSGMSADGTSYFWWNATSGSFVTLVDTTDLTAAGYVRVPSKRPTDSSTWDPVEQMWVTTAEVK